MDMKTLLTALSGIVNWAADNGANEATMAALQREIKAALERTAKKVEVVVTVDGGVTYECSDSEAVEVALIDLDDIRGGVEPMHERPDPEATGLIAEALREAWLEYDATEEQASDET